MIDRVVVWFSGGVTSAVAARLAVKKYEGQYPIVVAICDTGAEDPDNWRFADDVAEWIGYPITRLKSDTYTDTFDVYEKTGWVVGPGGARCSMELKKKVRQHFENIRTDLQIFGFSVEERGRALRFVDNNPLAQVEFPLIDAGITKDECHHMLLLAGIERPRTYNLGFNNANCLLTGCVKGGAGYWNHYRKIYPERFDRMAQLERRLDVAINKRYENGERVRVFLDELPEDMGNYNSEPVIQCGLFCGEI